MFEKLLFIVLIVIILVLISWRGYYTNWLIHYTVVLYGWYPVIIVDLVILVFFSILIWEG